MFVLTCPSCGHVVHVRFARRGATAKCAACGKLFRVGQRTVRLAQQSARAAASSNPSQTASDPAEAAQPATPIEALQAAAQRIDEAPDWMRPRKKGAALPARPAGPAPARHRALLLLACIVLVGLAIALGWMIAAGSGGGAAAP